MNEFMSRLLHPVCYLLIGFLNAMPQEEALLFSVDFCRCSVFTAAMIGQSGSLVLPINLETDTDGGRQSGREGGEKEREVGCTSQGGGRACHRGRGLLLHTRLPPSLRAGGTSRTLCADSWIDNSAAQPGRWMFCFL